LDMNEFRWEQMNTTDKPLSRAYLQACLVSGCLYLFGGYDGAKCVTDFRSIQLADEAVNMAKILFEESVSTQVAYAMKHFARANKDGGGSATSLDAKELETLFSNISVHLTSVTKTKAAATVSYPFDTQHVQNGVALGFTHDQVIAVLTQLHTEGANTSNFNLLVDRLINSPPQDLTRQASEKTHLKEELDKAIEEKEDLRQCVICCERLMNCVLLKCSHLCACEQCATDLKTKELPCPICRKPITGSFKVYWT